MFQFLEIGVVTSIELNHKQVETARKGQEVCIKIEPIPGESPKMCGRHFDETDMLISKVSHNITSSNTLRILNKKNIYKERIFCSLHYINTTHIKHHQRSIHLYNWFASIDECHFRFSLLLGKDSCVHFPLQRFHSGPRMFQIVSNR